MQNITLVCENCGKAFDRAIKEYKRNKRLGRKTFCSLSCNAVIRNQQSSKGNIESLITGSERDELSPFRWYINVCRQRKKHENNLTLEYLKILWDNQNGKCPYTKVDLKLPETTEKRCNALDYASLDRIDSTKGYIEGNVEFVSVFINYAKNKFSREQVQDFLVRIKS